MMNEGPYGIIETDVLVPRWTFPINKNQRVKRVEHWELGRLSGTVSRVRMVNDIHTIHKETEEQIHARESESETEIDLGTEATAFAKTGTRLLIKPKLRALRDRSKTDEIGPENIINVTDDEINKDIDRIERVSKTIRKHFMRTTIPRLIGFDIAAGETEAIVRDCLKTPLEIDDELVEYIALIGDADLLGSFLGESKNVPELVLTDVLKDFLIKGFDEIRALNKLKHSKNMFRRLQSDYEGMTARQLGSAKGLSTMKKQQSGEA